jgi:hypothetical protein
MIGNLAKILRATRKAATSGQESVGSWQEGSEE